MLSRKRVLENLIKVDKIARKEKKREWSHHLKRWQGLRGNLVTYNKTPELELSWAWEPTSSSSFEEAYLQIRSQSYLLDRDKKKGV